jgi:ubiquinone/menaquinone biosynthesis C-methylase UbiE
VNSRPDEVERQRRYFADVAEEYDSRVEDEFEHAFALSFLVGVIQRFSFQSVLDIGSGTGRAMTYLRSRQPDLRIQGVEPVEALRGVGHSKGIPKDDLIEGDATALHFNDNAFDVVCEFGVLHHIPRPEQAVTEMLRVAKRAILISDSNNFGQGRGIARSVKQAANAIRVWPALNYLKTRGKRFTYSEGDGVAYSYSVFNNYAQIAKACTSVHIVNTSADLWGRSPYRSAGHVALLGLLK